MEDNEVFDGSPYIGYRKSRYFLKQVMFISGYIPFRYIADEGYKMFTAWSLYYVLCVYIARRIMPGAMRSYAEIIQV